ncbi:MAG: winged helix-turn-helix domain-containing protein [Acidobacteria bacterium]|nr:winged helix-turn-helix domain-containing protein [Acidobacteriota bacterium]
MDYGSSEESSRHVHRLRQKIESSPSSPRYLRTVRGVGYTFGGDDGS